MAVFTAMLDAELRNYSAVKVFVAHAMQEYRGIEVHLHSFSPPHYLELSSQLHASAVLPRGKNSGAH